MVRYLEVTMSYDDVSGIVEETHREKEDEGAWGEPSEVTNLASVCKMVFPWVQLEMKLGV